MTTNAIGVAVPEAQSSLIKKLYETGAYSDLTVICGKDTYKVHQAIVCLRAEFFSKACRKNAWKEGETAQIILYEGDTQAAENEAELVRRMIHYLYCLDYPEESNNASFSDKPTAFPSPHTPVTPLPSANGLLIHSRMYALADYYNIPGLKDLAKTKFCQAAQIHWNSPEFGEVIEIIFTSTPSGDRGLRQAVKEIIQGHLSVMEKPEIESIMRELPDFAYDLLMIMREKSIIWNENITCIFCDNLGSMDGGPVMTRCKCGCFVTVGTFPTRQ